MKSYWLLKTEPSEYSFDQLVSDRRTEWDGVTNNQAQMYLRAINKGDRVLIYHTGKEKAIVGIAEVIGKPYPDPSGSKEKQVAIDIKPIRKFPYPVTLTAIKSQSQFDEFELVRNSRLSVMPVRDVWWHIIVSRGGL